MKKSLIALAVMAAAGAASAQSSVTLFGIVDAAITHGSASNGGQSFTGMTSSGYNSSRLGFRGTEDLGGGMSASFWLEGQLYNDDGQFGNPSGSGAFDFRRRSTVSLAGGWGEVRLGRDYTPSFWNLTVFDPFGTNGVGTNIMLVGANGIGANVVRASNSIGYFLPPNLGGFYGQVNYWFGENDATGNEDLGDGYGLRLGYGAGPFNVAMSFARTDLSTNTPVATDGDYSTWNLGGSWDFGMAKAMAQYQRDTLDTGAGDVDGRGWLVGALVPVGAGEIRAAYSEYRVDVNVAGVPDARARKLALGYVHNLSKRTALYATIARVRNNDGTAVTLGGATAGAGNFNSTGYDLGIRHSF